MKSLSSHESVAAPIPWRKYAVIAAVGLTIVVSWWQTEEHKNVEPGEPATQVSAASQSPQQTHALASRFASDAASLADDEYRMAALAHEAQMKRQRQQRPQLTSRHSTTTPHAHWQRQVDQLHERLVGFQEFPEGSIQWHLRERMKEMQLEEPQH